MPAPAGYSGTPLAKKLGLREGARVLLLHAPADYAQWVAPLPPQLQWARRADATVDLVHLFAASRAVLEPPLTQLRKALRPDAVLWVSWPKKASKVATDITEDVIRACALPLGWVDVKVCAVSDVWSGLKLVVRTALRSKS